MDLSYTMVRVNLTAPISSSLLPGSKRAILAICRYTMGNKIMYRTLAIIALALGYILLMSTAQSGEIVGVCIELDTKWFCYASDYGWEV